MLLVATQLAQAAPALASSVDSLNLNARPESNPAALSHDNGRPRFLA